MSFDDRAALREQLAEYAHRAWSGWMRYLFERSSKRIDGTVIIPFGLVERWERQMRTPYAELSTAEQDSDRIEADTILALLEDTMAGTTRALFVVNDVLERKNKDGDTMSVVVKMNPSYENGVNKAFWEATPTGSLEMQINNPAAFAFFRPGSKYWLDFTPAE